MLVNDFDIREFLLTVGFVALNDRTFQIENPSIKIKLIYPDTSYTCGYRRMAVSSPDRMFRKMETYVPRDKERANSFLVSIYNRSVSLDPAMNNTGETQGQVVKVIPKERGMNMWICINGCPEPALFGVKPGALDMAQSIAEGDHVYVIYKIESKQTDDIVRNFLNITSIQCLNQPKTSF